MKHIYLAFFSLLWLLSPGGTALASADEIDFHRDIRPILSDKCMYCYGPDENTREVDLRLDVREDVEYVLTSDELVHRVCSDDPDMVMPPPASNLSLSDTEMKLLKRWISPAYHLAQRRFRTSSRNAMLIAKQHTQQR